MSTKTVDLGEVIKEIRFAQDTLYFAANELSRERASDPMATEIGAIAQKCDAIVKVLEKRMPR